MRTSTFFLVLFLASAGVVSTQAQVLTKEQQDKMLQVLREQMGQQADKPSSKAKASEPRKEAAAKPAAQKAAKPAVEKPAPTAAATNPATLTPAPNPVAAAAQPAAAGPKTKPERLAELLARYKADKISPNEYHKERAKILTEP